MQGKRSLGCAHHFRPTYASTNVGQPSIPDAAMIPTPTGLNWNRVVPSGNDLQIIRLIRNRLVAESADDGAIAEIEDAGHLLRVFLDHADAVLANAAPQPRFPYRGNKEMRKNVFSRQLEDGAGMQGCIRIAHPLHIRKLEVVKVGLGPLGRPEMDEDGPNSLRLNRPAKPGDVLQSLAAKRASKMTKENQQERRLIQKRKQGPASLSAVLTEHRGHLRCLRTCLHGLYLFRIGRRQRHPHLPGAKERIATGRGLLFSYCLPVRQPDAFGWLSLNSILKNDAVIFRNRCHLFFRGRDSMTPCREEIPRCSPSLLIRRLLRSAPASAGEIPGSNAAWQTPCLSLTVFGL